MKYYLEVVMNSSNLISRKGKFDAGHRIMHERINCFNIHGHGYHYQMTFKYQSTLELGYPIDFKEIKRIACAWIEDIFDHAFIANPKDEVMLTTCQALASKIYVMHLIDQEGFCNPSAENIAKELFYCVSTLIDNDNLKLAEIVLYETPNCFVTCQELTKNEWDLLNGSEIRPRLLAYKKEKGEFEYDERKVK